MRTRFRFDEKSCILPEIITEDFEVEHTKLKFVKRVNLVKRISKGAQEKIFLPNPSNQDGDILFLVRHCKKKLSFWRRGSVYFRKVNKNNIEQILSEEAKCNYKDARYFIAGVGTEDKPIIDILDDREVIV